MTQILGICVNPRGDEIILIEIFKIISRFQALHRVHVLAGEFKAQPFRESKKSRVDL